MLPHKASMCLNDQKVVSCLILHDELKPNNSLKFNSILQEVMIMMLKNWTNW